MADIDKILSVYCLLAPGSCFWVAVLEGKVVGTVAARMSVDQRYRKCGVGVVLGRKVLEFAAHYGYSSVILGTTAYAPAAHRLYQRLGFCCVGSLLEKIFYRVLHHHYRIDVQNISLKWTPTTVNAQVTKNEGNF
uniref:N-acetylaspartate synthetase n=1 Tax=Maylandia zebra TaxID=106582 RepID=A0A3P9BXF4_9CICH